MLCRIRSDASQSSGAQEGVDTVPFRLTMPGDNSFYTVARSSTAPIGGEAVRGCAAAAMGAAAMG